MKKLIVLITITSAVTLSAIYALAQDAGGERRFGGPGGPGGPRQPMPIIAALDANKDGKIDASEIANAAAALKALDKNNDGELTPDEFAGPRPGGRRGGPEGGPGQRPPSQEQ